MKEEIPEIELFGKVPEYTEELKEILEDGNVRRTNDSKNKK
jgi:hypothetical protein